VSLSIAAGPRSLAGRPPGNDHRPLGGTRCTIRRGCGRPQAVATPAAGAIFDAAGPVGMFVMVGVM